MGTTMEAHRCIAQNAPLFLKWLRERGGIAIWESIDLSMPGQTWSTSVLNGSGNPVEKPTWRVGDKPSRIITDPAEVVVDLPKEVKRFHVAVRMGSQGMSLKLTDGSTRKVQAAVQKAVEGAWYEFDYSMQEAVIYVPGESLPILEWEAKYGSAE